MALATTGLDCPLGLFPIFSGDISNATSFMEHCKKIMLKAGWTVFDTVAATFDLHLGGFITTGFPTTVGSVVYHFTSLPFTSPNQIRIGSSNFETFTNMVQAINAGTGAGTQYSSGTVKNSKVSVAFIPPSTDLFVRY